MSTFKMVPISKSKKTSCPKRLRKQLNTEEFKQFYFELVPNHHCQPSSSTTSTTTLTTIKKEPDANSAHSDSDQYMLMSFQFEESEQEKIRKAIHQCSSHFQLSSYMHHSKRRKNHEHAYNNSTCSSSTSNSINDDNGDEYHTNKSTSGTIGKNQSLSSSSSSSVRIIQKNNTESCSTMVKSHSVNISQQGILSSLLETTKTNNTSCLSSFNNSSQYVKSSGCCMLSLDYEGIVKLLEDEKSPYCHLAKTPIYARHNYHPNKEY